MLKRYSYKAAAHWTNHKRGIVEGEAIPRTINFAAPPEFGGEPGLWTPEHLLLAAVSTCYVATLRAVAEASKLEFEGIEVPVEGKIEKLDGGFKFTRITLRPVVTIHQEQDRCWRRPSTSAWSRVPWIAIWCWRRRLSWPTWSPACRKL
jgi:organic hydroperoxide reductase OsmC/OhrA